MESVPYTMALLFCGINLGMTTLYKNVFFVAVNEKSIK